MDNNSWFFGASQNAVGGLVGTLIAAGVLAMSWARVVQSRWAAPLMYGLTAGASLYILLSGFLSQGGVPLSWWSLGVLLLFMFCVLSYVDKKSQEQKTASIKEAPGEIDLLAGLKFSPLLPLPAGYDRMIPARSSREGQEEGYKQAVCVWAASITGLYFSLLPSEARAKIDRVVFVDPASDCMRVLASIQNPRGERFSDNVKDAVELCKSEKVKASRKYKEVQEIQVRLSSHPVLNVVLFDPGTDHAWARVQEFIPYHFGEESVVYAIRKEEWKDLYETIEDSFKQTWENGKDPNK